MSTITALADAPAVAASDLPAIHPARLAPLPQHAYIVDPTIPLPASMRIRERRQVESLRTAYRAAMLERCERQCINSPEAVHALMRPLLGGIGVEQIWGLPHDTHCRLIHQPFLHTTGDVDGADLCLRSLLRKSLLSNATGLVVVHNHPAGNAVPSQADLAVTRRLAQACRSIDIPLSDHVVVAGDQFTSIRQYQPGCFH